MLKDIIENPGYKKVPFTGGMYEISIKGHLRHSVTHRSPELKVISDKLIADTERGNWFDGMELLTLVHITYKNIQLPVTLMDKIELIYRDNKTPLTATVYSSIQKSPVGKLTHPEMPDYCFIPGFSRYCISREGSLVSMASGKVLSPYRNQDGYLMYGVQPDVGKRTIAGMHRLQCLAWKEYPYNVDRLDINHIDSIKDNNDLDNLEWVTRSRNNVHAAENGLNNAQRVLVRNVETGEVLEFHSQAFASIYLNWTSMSYRLKDSNFGRVYDGYQVKLKTDERDWVDID